MREQSSTMPLEPEGVHFIFILRQFERGLKDFVIVYYVRDFSGEREIARYDCSHGFAHRDLPYLKRGDKRRKTRLPEAPMERQYAIAKEDIEHNWKKYYRESGGKHDCEVV